MNNPLISICIPAYNAAPFITETINCWTQQSYVNLEIIVQDDCSTDDTYDIALSLAKKDPRIIVYRNGENLGIGNNWNEAHQHAKGNFLVIFNADDLIEPDFLEKSLAFFKLYPETDFIIHPYIKSDEVNIKPELILQFQKYTGLTHDLINMEGLADYRIHWNYTLAKRKSLEQLKNTHGLFYPTQVCDAMLWFEAQTQNLNAYYTGQIAGIYRMHESNNSKIPLGEFESTLLWMIPTYSDLFRRKTNINFKKKYILLIKYVYACLKDKKIPKLILIKNIINYV